MLLVFVFTAENRRVYVFLSPLESITGRVEWKGETLSTPSSIRTCGFPAYGFPAFATDRISSLEEISMFTYEKDVPLKDVLKSIYDKENGGKAIDPKSDAKLLKEYMEAILPEFDRDRVYVSDMKKLFTWYNLLQENNMIDFSATEEVEETPVSEEK